MEIINNIQFDEIYYKETLQNGLKVVIYHKPHFKTSACVFATPYGALDVNQLVDNVIVKNNPGIAHFLEHKLFESDEGDVMSKFGAMGCNVNAFTSYNETCYYFSASLKNIDEPLNLLLDFVQNLNISIDSVEKEKGIIIQELNMYQQNPDSRLIYEMFKGLYVNHPLKYDIGGDTNSVTNITYDELTNCYNVNYHPSNMTLVIVTPVDPNHIINVIKNNQSNKKFDQPKNIKRYFKDEPKEVANEYVNVDMDITNNKVCYSFKISDLNMNSLDLAKYEWAIRFILEMHFSPLNDEYQKRMDDKLINDYFGYEVDFGDGYALIMFYGESDNEIEFKSFINEQLKSLKISNEMLVQLKRRYYGKAFNTFNDVEDIAINYIRHNFSNLVYEDVIEMVNNIDFSYLEEVKNNLPLKDSSLVCIKKM